MRIFRFNELNENVNVAKTQDQSKQNNYLFNRNEISDLLDKSDIPDSIFHDKFSQRGKYEVVSFLKEGDPSQYYFEEILNILEEYGADISDFII
jgi:hypothetical protein